MKQLRQSSEDTATFMIELDNKSAGMVYETAGTLSVFPSNDPATVEQLAKLQSWDLNQRFVLVRQPGSTAPLPFPGPLSVREALTSFCDLTGLPLYILERSRGG